MRRRLLCLLAAVIVPAMLLTGCGVGSALPASSKSEETPSGGEASADETAGSVYYLNFKPEAEAAWQDLAAAYTEETGVPVTVVTAASGEYENTLMSEMARPDPPTLFQINGPVGLANWKDYCYDLSGSEIVSKLTSDAFELRDGDAVLGVAYVIESYGIITNVGLLEKAGYTLDDIQSFDDLKRVADDLQARRDGLGIKGAFASAGMDASSDWRFKTHLANLPIYYEYKADGIDTTKEIKGTYLDQYRNVFDLYITDSTCSPDDLAFRSLDDARAEFAKGEAVFYQNGSWEYGSLSGYFTDDQIAMIPIYFGVDDANEGLCTGTENYWCVNAEASEEDIAATLDFINWCVTSGTGTKTMAETMGFTIPFETAAESPNVFVKQDATYMESGKTPVSWSFTTIPSENWKNNVGFALITYAFGIEEWDAVVSTFVDGWAMEAALSE